MIDCFVTFSFEMTNDGESHVSTQFELLRKPSTTMRYDLRSSSSVISSISVMAFCSSLHTSWHSSVTCSVMWHMRQRFWRELLLGCISIALQLHLLV